VIPAPRTSWWSLLKKESAPPHRETEIRNRDDDEYDYPESRHYPVDHHYPEDRHYPESHGHPEDHRYPVNYRQPEWHRYPESYGHPEDHRYPVNYRQPDEHHYPESYHYRSPPPAPYRTSEHWDDDPRAAPPINVHVHVENRNENHHEVEASDNSGGLRDKAFLIVAAIGGLVVFAWILGGHGPYGWGPYGWWW
jgi:hypothetical protein